ncbi:MAG TPA: hypothetical protein ENI23_07200 [bacterium]|nr:hypothetical protein [bacterium]
MLKFEPPELLTKICKAAQKFEESCSLCYDWYPFHDEGFDPANYHEDGDDDEIINSNSIIEGFSFRHSDVCFDLSVAEFLELADILESGQLIDRSEFRSSEYTIVYIVPSSEQAHSYVYGDISNRPDMSQKVTIEDTTYEVQLISHATPFSLLLEEEGGCEDYCPSLSDNDLFVKVDHPSNTSPQLISDIIDSYLFELSASFFLDFTRTRYPEAFYGWEDLDFTPIVDDKGKIRIRTPNISNGLPELYRIYLRGVTASDVEHQIINLVKAIEYVSATVIRLTSHDAIRQRLLSPKALAPDAKFLDDLIMLVEDQRIYRKDSEALRLTINTCCDTTQLAPHAPPVLKTLSSLSEASDAKTKKTALDDLSKCLSSTRNQLVHAKANYTLTGNECPSDQLSILAGCVNLAATQVIRWFAGLPTESRVF